MEPGTEKYHKITPVEDGAVVSYRNRIFDIITLLW